MKKNDYRVDVPIGDLVERSLVLEIMDLVPELENVACDDSVETLRDVADVTQQSGTFDLNYYSSVKLRCIKLRFIFQELADMLAEMKKDINANK